MKLSIEYRLIIANLLILVINGCNDSGRQEILQTEKIIQVTPQMEDLPECDEIAAILGDLITDMVPAGEKNSRNHFNNVTAYGVECTWLTQDSLSDDPLTKINTASFGVGITIDENTLKEAPLREMGMVYDDHRAEEIGGFVVYMGGNLDPREPLGTVGPQVVVGKITVTSAATGELLQREGSSRRVTNDQAIEAAVTLHKSLH